MGNAWFLLDELTFSDATPAVNENIALLSYFERFLNTGEFTLPANEFHLLGSFRLGSVRVRLKSESKLHVPMAMTNMISIMTDIVDVF